MKNIIANHRRGASMLWLLCNRILLTTICLLLLSTSLAANEVKEDSSYRVSLNIVNKRIDEALKEIQKSSNYVIFYHNENINTSKKVNLKSENITVEEALDKILEDSGNSYKIDGRQVYVTKKSETNGQQQGSVKKSTIKGVVKESGGESVIGASISVKGTTVGTITDIDGKFTLNNVPENATIVVSYIGFNTQEFKAEEGKDHQIILKEDEQMMDEVVVIGYGTERRSLVTSAISKMKMDETNLRQTTSPAQLLNGRIAGVSVGSNTGNLGGAEKMSIRGSASLNASNEPLYVIDGVPITNPNANLYNVGESMSSLSTINLNDIESIDILKDAASAAIYGSRATNGVVVITTKSGKEGRSDIKVNFNTGFSKFPNMGKLKVANSDTYIMQYNEGVDNYNKQYSLGIGDSGYKTHIQNPFGNLPDTNWMELITQTGTFYNVDAAFSGGNKKTRFYVGASYSNQEGIIKTNKLEKINLKAKISHEMTNWLEIGANTSGNFLKNHQVPGSESGATIIGRAILQRPFARPYKPNGDYYQGGTDELRFHNPMQILNEQDMYLENLRFLGTFYAQFKYKDMFTFKSSVNADMMNMYDYTYYNENHPYGTGVGRLLDYNNNIRNMLMENVLTYKDKFGDFSVSGMAGHSFQKITQRTINLDGRGFPSPSFNVIGVASEIAGHSGNNVGYAMESYFGRASAAYKERYILTGTLRTDGSSKFARDKRWGWFPSISLGWNVSEEDFMKDSGVDLKFRMSYGRTGNQEGISRYAYQSLMSGGNNYGNVSGIATSNSDFGNKDVSWEKADQYDIGLDATFLNGKINTMLDFYLKNTSALLYNMPMHATTGMTSLLTNIGSMRNKGVEFTLNTHFNLGKVEWLAQFNIATNKNKLTKLLGHDKPISIGGNRALQVGKELGAYYIFEQEGIYQYDGEVPNEQYIIGVRAGDVKWRDVDGNGIINDSDRVVKGSSNPDFFGGLNNTFKYRNFQLDVFFTYMYGNEVLAQWQNDLSKVGHTNAVLQKYVDRRWTGPGTTNKYPRSLVGDTHNTKNSDRILEDGSFIRLRSLTFAYNVPQQFLNKYHIKGLRAFFQADNVFTLTKYTGWDPETSNNLDPRFFGVATLGVPQPRTFSFGVNVNF